MLSSPLIPLQCRNSLLPCPWFRIDIEAYALTKAQSTIEQSRPQSGEAAVSRSARDHLVRMMIKAEGWYDGRDDVHLSSACHFCSELHKRRKMFSSNLERGRRATHHKGH